MDVLLKEKIDNYFEETFKRFGIENYDGSIESFANGAEKISNASFEIMKNIAVDLDLKKDMENPDYYIFGIESPYCRRKEKLFLPSPYQMSKNVAGNIWRENVRDILGINKKMYWFKHKGANDKEDVGISLDVVKEIFRHGSEKVTEIYATKHQERVFEKARTMIPEFK